MATSVYLFVKTDQKYAWNVTTALRNVSGVKEAHCVTGKYDVIAQIEAADLNALAGLLKSHVYNIPGVLRTTTSVIVD